MALDEGITLSADDEQRQQDACKAQWLDGVPAAFAGLPAKGDKLEIHTADQFPDKFCYTEARENGGGNENHFQGCQRLLEGNFFAISGGDWRNKSSHLFVGKLPSRPDTGKWGSNIDGKRPPDSDVMVARIDLHPQMWHAGGIALCGNVLAVPVECGPGRAYKVRGVKPPECDTAKSRIYLIDVSTPASPMVLKTAIDREKRKATAVALAHVPSEGYVAAVLSAEGEEQAADPSQFIGKRIEFYRSTSNALSGGFAEPVTYRVPVGLTWDDYQTINFVRDTSGTLYMFGMTGQGVDLFKVTLPQATPKVAPDLHFLERREFVLDRRYAEFKAGVGIFTRGGFMGMYAVPQWRRLDGRLGLTEWA